MLEELQIRNLAVIEDLTLAFGPGFNVITGETGAGKSLLVDALGLALGRRADPVFVRADAERASVEACFRLDDATRANLEPLLRASATANNWRNWARRPNWRSAATSEAGNRPARWSS